MGIGSTVKNMLSGDTADENPQMSEDYGTAEGEHGERLHLTNSRRAQKLPPGQGIGTSGRSADPASVATNNTASNVPGHYQETSAVPASPPNRGSFAKKTKQDKNTLGAQPPHHQTTQQGLSSRHAHQASEAMVQHDVERSKTYGIAGYGTDAAAAAGGSLDTTHQRLSGADQTSRRQDYEFSSPEERVVRDSTSSYSTSSAAPPTRESYVSGVRSPTMHTTIRESHTTGHTRNTGRDVMPSGKAEEDTNQLEPVTHERVRHLETEEIGRVTEHERHVHHVQHHTQPIVAREELAEQRTEVTQPATHISETHVNKAEDKSLFEGQISQHRDTLSHGAKERTVIDKGNTVHESVHHHVHHVIQPVIEKETVDKRRIHTTIPIHEVTHEAPVVHQSQAHAPIPLEHFLQKGGSLKGTVSHEEVGKKVLHHGTCTRDVEGDISEDFDRSVRIGDSGDRVGSGDNREEYRTTTQTTVTDHKHGENLNAEKLAAKAAAERAQQTGQTTTAHVNLERLPKN